MANDKLHDLLIQLHEELGRAGNAGGASGAILKDLRRDIARMLEQPDGGPGAQRASLAENLRNAISRFEASHPGMTSLMNRVCDALSDIGI